MWLTETEIVPPVRVERSVMDIETRPYVKAPHLGKFFNGKIHGGKSPPDDR